MTGKYNSPESWQKQWVYDLDNGFQAVVEYSNIYGDHISRINFPNGDFWHCSNGLDKLPDFARAWVRGGDGADRKLVNVGFTKEY